MPLEGSAGDATGKAVCADRKTGSRLFRPGDHAKIGRQRRCRRWKRGGRGKGKVEKKERMRGRKKGKEDKKGEKKKGAKEKGKT